MWFSIVVSGSAVNHRADHSENAPREVEPQKTLGDCGVGFQPARWAGATPAPQPQTTANGADANMSAPALSLGPHGNNVIDGGGTQPVPPIEQPLITATELLDILDGFRPESSGTAEAAAWLTQSPTPLQTLQNQPYRQGARDAP